MKVRSIQLASLVAVTAMISVCSFASTSDAQVIDFSRPGKIPQTDFRFPGIEFDDDEMRTPDYDGKKLDTARTKIQTGVMKGARKLQSTNKARLKKRNFQPR